MGQSSDWFCLFHATRVLSWSKTKNKALPRKRLPSTIGPIIPIHKNGFESCLQDRAEGQDLNMSLVRVYAQMVS